MKFIRGISLLLLLAVMTVSGCSTYNTVQLRQENISGSYHYYQPEPPLYAGDTIKYRLKNGDKGEMIIRKVEPAAIVGTHGQSVQLADVAALERKEFAKGKTAAAVGGGAVATAVVLGVAFAVALIGSIKAL